MNVVADIFRAYDIRGVVPDELNENTVLLIGKALGSYALSQGETEIIVARDGRLSSPQLMQALQQGLLSTGINIIDIGMVPTATLYFATYTLRSQSGVMLTGSHNPGHYNGLKMVIAGKTLATDQVAYLYDLIIENKFQQGVGHITQQTILDEYLKTIIDNITFEKPLKIAIDCGNGIGGVIAPQLFKALGCEVIECFCEVDGSFPNHHPDPSDSDNLQDLIHAVKEHNADIGLAFDGDADRLGVVTPRGEIIWPDRQLMLMAQSVLKQHPGATIVFDVKCSALLTEVIEQAGGVAVMSKTGHSLIKAKMLELDAKLAGELSGHIFFNDKWFGFDDGIYAGARLLEILSASEQDIDALFSKIPNRVNTPELKIIVDESEKFSLMQQIIDAANFPAAHVNTIDGIRVEWPEGWGLVRASNTTPCLVLRFEAVNTGHLQRIKHQIKQALLAINPQLQFPY